MIDAGTFSRRAGEADQSVVIAVIVRMDAVEVRQSLREARQRISTDLNDALAQLDLHLNGLLAIGDVWIVEDDECRGSGAVHSLE